MRLFLHGGARHRHDDNSFIHANRIGLDAAFLLARGTLDAAALRSTFQACSGHTTDAPVMMPSQSGPLLCGQRSGGEETIAEVEDRHLAIADQHGSPFARGDVLHRGHTYPLARHTLNSQPRTTNHQPRHQPRTTNHQPPTTNPQPPQARTASDCVATALPATRRAREPSISPAD